jgi:hypothetical protein
MFANEDYKVEANLSTFQHTAFFLHVLPTSFVLFVFSTINHIYVLSNLVRIFDCMWYKISFVYEVFER